MIHDTDCEGCRDRMPEIDVQLGRLACDDCACDVCEGWGVHRMTIDLDETCAACDGTGREDGEGDRG